MAKYGHEWPCRLVLLPSGFVFGQGIGVALVCSSETTNSDPLESLRCFCKDLMLFLYGNGSLITYFIFLGNLALKNTSNRFTCSDLYEVTLFPPSFGGSHQALAVGFEVKHILDLQVSSCFFTFSATFLISIQEHIPSMRQMSSEPNA